jgi:hypothetical protein
VAVAKVAKLESAGSRQAGANGLVGEPLAREASASGIGRIVSPSLA